MRACDADGAREVTDNKTLPMERTFQAPAEAVFDGWTGEEVIQRWWHAEHDWETTEAEVDLRVGGVVRVVMRDPHTSSPERSCDYDRMVPRDRWGMRRAFRTPPGRSAVSWRWEIGLPLFLMGSLTALIAAGAKGGGILFWGGTVVAAVGASICFAGLIGR
jgi:uncharacterized protein YndB with AHSA1/START domain